MVPRRYRKLTAQTRRRSWPFLDVLNPVDPTPFRQPSSGWVIWGSLLLVWLLSLLPWRLWLPAPDLLLLVICVWCLNEPQRINLVTAFCFGLLMDVHDGALMGVQALEFTLAAYGAVALHKRLQNFSSLVQAVHLLPIFVVAAVPSVLIVSWMQGGWLSWDWLWSALLTGALWPLADFLLLLPQRRLDEPDADAA